MLTRNWKWILVVFVLAITAALPFLFRPPERRLLVLATKVVSTKGWLDDNQDFYYQWLPGNRIFTWRSLPPNQCEPMEIDAATGREIPLPGFHQRFPKPHSRPSGWQVSPDGQWLLWSEIATPMTWTAAKLDGSQVIQWLVRGDGVGNGESFGIWRPDSRSWMEIGRRKGDLHSYVHSLNTLTAVQDTAVKEPKGGLIWYLSDAVSMQDAIVVTLQNSIHDYGFAKFPTGRRYANSTDLPLHVSLFAYCIELKFTRDGLRVAWANQDDGQNEHPTWIEQFSEWVRHLLKQPQPKPASEPVQQLWVGDLDGKHKRLIGYIPPQKDGDELHSIHWMTDEKCLSFIYKGTLYTVPAE